MTWIDLAIFIVFGVSIFTFYVIGYRKGRKDERKRYGAYGPFSDHDKAVIDAASHLEFVANTPGPHVDGASFEEVLFDLVLYGEWNEELRELLDRERRERIERAWKKLRHALEVRRVAMDKPFTDYDKRNHDCP